MRLIAVSTKVFLYIVISLISFQISAAGPEKYKKISELGNAELYRLTCSDVSSHNQVHLYLEILKGKVEEARLIFIFPSESLQVIDLKKSEIQISLSNDSLNINGTFSDSYYGSELNVELNEKKRGLSGQLKYDDHDGASVNRNVQCQALNYIISPIK